MSFFCVLSCVVCDESPHILKTTDAVRPALVFLSSVLAHSPWFSLQAFDLYGIWDVSPKMRRVTIEKGARRASSDGSMSASGSAGPGFDPRRGSKFSFEIFQTWG